MKNTKDTKNKSANKSNLLKTAGAIATFIAVPTLSFGQSAEADSTNQSNLPEFSKNSIEYHAQSDGNNKGRINVFGDLPLKGDFYGFAEFYQKNGYFGKIMLYVPVGIVKGLGTKIETKHSSFASTEAGFGLEYRLFFKDGFASIKALPLVLGKKVPMSIDGLQDAEGHIKGKAIVGYLATKTFPITNDLDIILTAFGDVAFDIKKGTMWDYGETQAAAKIKTKAGAFELGVGTNHNVTGKSYADTKFRINFGYYPIAINKSKGYHVKK